MGWMQQRLFIAIKFMLLSLDPGAKSRAYCDQICNAMHRDDGESWVAGSHQIHTGLRENTDKKVFLEAQEASDSGSMLAIFIWWAK